VEILNFYREFVAHIADQHLCVVLFVPELCFTTSKKKWIVEAQSKWQFNETCMFSAKLRVCSIPVVVIMQWTVGNHCRNVRMRMLKWKCWPLSYACQFLLFNRVRPIVVAVSVEENSQASEVVLGAEHLAQYARFLYIPNGNPVCSDGNMFWKIQ